MESSHRIGRLLQHRRETEDQPSDVIASGLFDGAPQPLEGKRAAIREKELPVSAGATPRFALFAQSSGETAKQVVARHANLLEPDLRELFHAGGLWLVRPDGYVALATKQGR
jgi:hypothetical protein